jgi:hypothetical protein
VRIGLVLATAGAAALGGLAAAVAGVLADPAVQDCRGALAAANEANTALIDTYGPLVRAEVRARHHGDAAAGLPEARLLVEQRQHELDAARAAVTRLCHHKSDSVGAR